MDRKSFPYDPWAIAEWAKRCSSSPSAPKIAEMLELAVHDALAYLDFPSAHWKHLRTNNVQERTNREMKRGTRVAQVFPSVRSLERLAGSVMCDQDEAWNDARHLRRGLYTNTDTT